MFEILIVGAIAYFAGLGTAVLVPDLAVIPAGWIRRGLDWIKRRSPKE